MRRRPYSVVLFDEIEKAHPDVMQTLLQILEEGRLTDSLGRQIDFRNTVVILTSNLGVDAERSGQHFGFTAGAPGDDQDAIKNHLLSSAKKVFKPELLNRFDETIVFRKLERKDVVQILDIELDKIRARLSKREISLKLTPEAMEFLADKGSNTALGARPMRRTVEQRIEDPLAEGLLKEAFVPPCTVTVYKKRQADELSFRSRKKG